MDHRDHLYLLKDGITHEGGIWAELGSGGGAFTLALAELLGPMGTLYSIDRDKRALDAQKRAMSARFPQHSLRYLAADFTRSLDLPPLDGILMANSLHFVRNKTSLLRQLSALLKEGGQFVLVEYNTDHGNPWVPHPVAYPTWARLADEVGLAGTRLLAAVPSRFLGEIYSAASIKP